MPDHRCWRILDKPLVYSTSSCELLLVSLSFASPLLMVLAGEPEILEAIDHDDPFAWVGRDCVALGFQVRDFPCRDFFHLHVGQYDPACTLSQVGNRRLLTYPDIDMLARSMIQGVGGHQGICADGRACSRQETQ